jgi:pimeloyl-ACP methyl ester carboxylesterase
MPVPIPKSIVFISGTFISNDCWGEWIEYFQQEGYACTAPAWPDKDASPEELRNRETKDAVSLNTISSLTNHFTRIIETLDGKPILIGHSLGGLIVQLLLQRGLGTAGVAIHSFPPAGIRSFRFSFLKTLWKTMAIFSSNKETYLMPFATWRYAIANGMEYEQQKELYYLYAIPESKKIIREAFRCVANIDFKKPHAPLLLTSGSNDKLIPISLSYLNYKKYVDADSIIDYKEFRGHTHLVFGHSKWRREADHILCWLEELK